MPVKVGNKLVRNFYYQLLFTVPLREKNMHSEVKCMSIFCGLHRLVISRYCYFPYPDSANTLHLENYFITCLGYLSK